ncbi:MAG: NADH:ubiquinone oxidoreductase [Cirrosporium novae-zelandiae]|nr:MAG: NADH:ubiquinone oxidoreductase [Cirrosporium novae-zelandiae]
MPASNESQSPYPGPKTSTEDALAYYKSQYETLESELADFQASSRELEAELEKDVEASEKRERDLQEKLENLGYEVEEWKTKYKKAKNEANTAQNKLQKEITSLREANRTLQLTLRDMEVANDDYERQTRNTTSSLEDLESKYNIAIERGVMLEEEIKNGEQEREELRINTQRLKEEFSDLKIEAEITQDKLRHAEATLHAPRLNSNLAVPSPQSPISETSPTTSSSSQVTTPPTKSSASDAPTPPSPPISETSTNPAPSITPSISKTRLAVKDLNITPRPFSYRTPHNRSTSISQPRSGRSTPSISIPRRSIIMRENGIPPPGGNVPRSGSLYQIRGLIGKMQKLEQRVQSARSRLPAPMYTPPRYSPRPGSAAGQNIPSSITVRSHRKRTTGGSSVASSVREEDETPSSLRRFSRASTGLPATPTPDNHSMSRPSSRTSVSTRTSVSHQSYQHSAISRPSSRQSGAMTPLGHYSNSAAVEGRRPRSSLSGNYGALHGHAASASVNHTPGKGETVASTPRRATFSKSQMGGSSIPTPGALKKRQSGNSEVDAFSERRISAGRAQRDREQNSMPPPERRTRLSDLGETY